MNVSNVISIDDFLFLNLSLFESGYRIGEFATELMESGFGLLESGFGLLEPGSILCVSYSVLCVFTLYLFPFISVLVGIYVDGAC